MANGPKRASNANKIANRKVAWAKAQKLNLSNNTANKLRNSNNLSALIEAGMPPVHIETRTHTKRVLNKKTKMLETVEYQTTHAERPSKALRRIGRQVARELAGFDAVTSPTPGE
jgi:hypothetical protein